MKKFFLGLSLVGLMTGFSVLSLAETSPNTNTDAEVLALVNSAKVADATAQVKTVGAENAVASPKTVALSEDELPAFKNTKLEKKEATTSGTVPWLKMFGSLAMVLTLIFGGVWGFKKLPQAQKLAGRAKMIQVLGQHHLGAKKSLAVIRVAGETVLVGVTDNNITLIKSLSLLDEDLPGETTVAKNQKFTQTLQQKLNTEEEFSMKGIKDIVSGRLQQMKGYK